MLIRWLPVCTTPQVVQGKSQDARRYPAHGEVLRYLEAFAEHFDLRQHVRLCTRVKAAVPQAAGFGAGDAASAWQVTTEPSSGATGQRGDGRAAAQPSGGTETYDAVMVCNGHYAVPRLPPMEGVDVFPGRCEHSHSYRRPEGYAGQRVVIIGAHASGAPPCLRSGFCGGESLRFGAVATGCTGQATRIDQLACAPRPRQAARVDTRVPPHVWVWSLRLDITQGRDARVQRLPCVQAKTLREMWHLLLARRS